jgi:hypothetical protein
MKGKQIPFEQYATRAQERIEKFYRVPVTPREFRDAFVGDLNGAEIQIAPRLSAEQRLFLLGHLFGHTVQWNLYSSTFEIGRSYRPPVNEYLLPAIVEYGQRWEDTYSQLWRELRFGRESVPGFCDVGCSPRNHWGSDPGRTEAVKRSLVTARRACGA